MAIKSKKYKSYQTKWKGFAIVCFFVVSMVTFFCGIIFTNISKSWHLDAINVETFYDTMEFRNYFYKALDQVVLADIYYESESAIESGSKIDRDELIAGFKRYYGIADGVITGNTEINDTYDGLIVYGTIPEKMKNNFLEYQALVENRLPLYKEIYIQNQLDEYRSAERFLETMENFCYYVEDGKGNVVAGNATPSEIHNMEHTIMLSREFRSDNLSNANYYPYVSSILEKSQYQIYAAIRSPLVKGDEFYVLSKDFHFAKASMPCLFGVTTATSLILLFCLIYLIRVTGQKEKGGVVHYITVDHIFNEIHFLLVVLVGIFSFFMGFTLLNSVFEEVKPFWLYVFITLLGLLYIADVAVGLSYILSVARQIKGGSFFRNTLLSTLIRQISSFFTGATFRGWMMLIMITYGMINCILVFLMCMFWYSQWMLLFLVGLLAFNAFCIYLFLRSLRSLSRIMISARETSQGNLQHPLDLATISPSFLNFAEDIANIQDGLKNAVEEAIKGERMKTDLITNVSHDLKTPLTSIITYVDLLKQEKLENKTAEKYVGVLYEKSYRLKQLIEDLIEVSKVSSGNVTVEKIRVDYRQLMMQALGEMEEKIADAGLEVKISCPEPVFIDADGRHMWRILENLISNAVKYAMANSRLYIDIFSTEERGILVMKNISAAPIDFDATRLTERFVRGDASRTTEGSGLGLSITRSLTEVQGGAFGVEMDGDLFKVIVNMPLWKNEIEERWQEEQQEAEETKWE